MYGIDFAKEVEVTYVLRLPSILLVEVCRASGSCQ